MCIGGMYWSGSYIVGACKFISYWMGDMLSNARGIMWVILIYFNDAQDNIHNYDSMLNKILNSNCKKSWAWR